LPDTKIVPLRSITVARHRLRALREDNVEAIAQSMAKQGQLQPIVVRPQKDGGYWLVAGLHRLEAAKKLEWKGINCTIFDDMEADRAELIEIDENLIRADLTAAERALHTTKRKELYDRFHPETRKGAAGGRAKAAIRKGPGANAQIERTQTFVKDTAKKTGTGRSSVQRDVTRGKKVKVLRDIVGTSLDKGAEIDALAKLPASIQESLAKAAKTGEKVSAIARRASDRDAEDPMMSEGTEEIELGKAIARLRRQQPHNKDMMFICDALQRALQRGHFRSARAH
jgi:ParB-like chromosome segregation protein Spo0J